MVDQATIARLKAFGFKFFGLSGEEFLVPDGRVISADQALAIVNETERKGEADDDVSS